MKFAAIIPARYASTRFPGKPLVNINGKPMIQHVYEQTKKAASLNTVIVATDNERIADAVIEFGGVVVMTSAAHQNGTERCAEAAASLDADVIINVQGDEPFIKPEQIELLCSAFNNDKTEIATLIKQEINTDIIANPSRIKVVVNHTLQALYFSRAAIPFQAHNQSKAPVTYYTHIGLYAFKRNVLLDIVKLPTGRLESIESLEQLRWLENEYQIQCVLTQHDSHSVDTPADLELLTRNIKFIT